MLLPYPEFDSIKCLRNVFHSEACNHSLSQQTIGVFWMLNFKFLSFPLKQSPENQEYNLCRRDRLCSDFTDDPKHSEYVSV